MSPNESSSADIAPFASQSHLLKRPLSEECEVDEGNEACQKMEVESEGEQLVSKRPRDSNSVTTSNTCKRHDMNFPLPNEKGVAAIVKVSTYMYI